MANRREKTDLIRIAIPLACLLSVTMHIALLQVNDLDWKVSPIAALSHTEHVYFHTLSLWLFALAQWGLTTPIKPAPSRPLTRAAKYLGAVASLLIVVMSFMFQFNDNTNQIIILAILASVVGTVMALLIPATQRICRPVFLLNGMCLLLWIVLIPIGFYVDPQYIGAYQRSVATVYILWLAILGGFLCVNES